MNAADIDYNDVQGTILRGYRVDYARHFILSINDSQATGQLIQSLISGNNGLPKITTAKRLDGKPDSFLNVSFTCPGLAKMGVSADDLMSFDTAFQKGASSTEIANTVGDIGNSAPANWLGGLGNGEQVHLLVSLWVRDSKDILNSLSAKLTEAFNGAATVLLVHDAEALPDDKIHFGYRDSIAQPTVIGAPPSKTPDDQPAVATGEFLLGYENEIGGTYQVTPSQLSTNSSYAAFRILEQDVAAYDALLESFAETTGLETEHVAAKICGRWRNGNPLTLSPTSQEPLLPTDELNNFTYVTPPAETDDTLGLTCPIGSHIRRNNPRNEAIVGSSSSNHRITRRAMPYGSPYNPDQPDDSTRGLIGYFINASINNQFQFLTSQWNQKSDFVKSATAPGGTPEGNAVFNISGEDVFLGINDTSDSSFTFAAAGNNGANNINATGFGRTITTRGGIYCFFPSMTGLGYLANLPASTE
jgi:Dyp-type peroxidase family